VHPAYPSFQLCEDNIVLKEIVGRGSGGAIHKAEYFGAIVAAKVLPCQGMNPESLGEIQALRYI